MNVVLRVFLGVKSYSLVVSLLFWWCLGLGVVGEFKPDVGLVGLYRVYLALVLFFGFLWWMVPVGVVLWFEAGVVFAVGLFLPVLVVVGFVLFWIPRFCSSVRFVLDEDKVVVVKGVWWRSESFVPYNRVTNVNVFQGPVSRWFGLGKVSIQTAGFSGTSGGGGKVAEAVIFGIKNFEEVKDVVMGFVRGVKPEAVEAEARPSGDVDQLILAELRKIRKALEK